jgi:hypothetical protein
MSSGKLWSGLYHPRALRPRAFIATILASLAARLAALVAALRALVYFVTYPAQLVCKRRATPSAGATDAPPAAPPARPASPSVHSTGAAADDETMVTFELPALGGAWADLNVPLHPDVGGSLRLRVRASAWEERPIDVHAAADGLPLPSHVAPASDTLGETVKLGVGMLGKSLDAMLASAPLSLTTPPPQAAVPPVLPFNGGALPPTSLPPPTPLMADLTSGMEHVVLPNGHAAISFYPSTVPAEYALLWLPGRNDVRAHGTSGPMRVHPHAH